MVLKMDNTYASAPQVGLGSADMVVEELVEGGITRLAVIYYSELPGDGRPRALHAGHRHRDRLAGRRRRWSPAAAPRSRCPGSPVPGSRTSPRATPGSSATRAHRAVQPVHRLTETAAAAQRDGAPARPTTCRGARTTRPPRGSAPPRSRPASPPGTPRRGPTRDGRYVNENTYAARATSSLPTPCWCCGSRSATPATSTPPATRSRRRSSSGRARRCSSTTAGWCAGTWTKDSLQRAADAVDRGAAS